MSDLLPDLSNRPDRTLKLLLVDPDPIFRVGFLQTVGSYSGIQVVAEVETGIAARKILADLARVNATAFSSGLPSDTTIHLVVLELHLGLELCQQIKSHYPDLPILILSSVQEPTLIAAAKTAGIEGYCPKGSAVAQVVTAIRQVASGSVYWLESAASDPQPVPGVVGLIRNQLRWTGLQQIDATLAAINARLQPGLPLLDRAFLAGQRRELLASRWLVTHLLPLPETQQSVTEVSSVVGNTISTPVTSDTSVTLPSATNTSLVSIIRTGESSLSHHSSSDQLLEEVSAKLDSSLENLTNVPLELDIFRDGKKRELLKIILQKLARVLDDLRFSQVSPNQLVEIQPLILRDLWQGATIDFFGRYATLQIENRNLEIVNLLLQDVVIVQVEILDKIPLVSDLFAYLLFKTPLTINNAAYPADTPEAKERAQLILQNTLIQVANAVIQPLLNRLADVEAIKQNFYDQRLISTREIERFRNDLSWRYRYNKYIYAPTAIFESRYDLFILINRGIAKTSVYAPRRQELSQLRGIPQTVTLGLELRDAIAPRIRSVVSFLGSGVVYVLTQVVGRAIGLVGRGFLQGIGGSAPERKRKKF